MDPYDPPRPLSEHRSRFSPVRRPQGFQQFGLRPLYHLILPRLGIRRRRVFFNHVSDWIILAVAMISSLVGLILGGPILGIVGWLIAASVTEASLRRNRFIR